MAEQTPAWTLEDALKEAQQPGTVLENVVGKPAASAITGPIERLLGLESGIRPAPAPAPRQLPEGMEPGLPSTAQAVEAFGAGTTEGLLGLTPAAGAATGAVLGMKAGAMSPLPGGTFFGGLAGTGAGYLVGLQAEKAGKTLLPLTRDDLRAYREAGKTFGSSVGMIAPFAGYAGRAQTAAQAAADKVALSMPQTSVDWVKAILQQPAAFYRKNPGAFMSSETAAAAGAAAGAGLVESEASWAGDPAYRMFGEITGGMLAGFIPSVFLSTNASNALVLLQNIQSRVSPERRREMASDYFIRLYQKAGMSPEEARRMLEVEQPDIVTKGGQPGMTAAQLTGIPILSALENTLAKGNASAGKNFALEVERRGKNALLAFHGVLQDLAYEGSPEALKQLAKLREQHALSLLQGRFELAHKNVADAIAKMRVPRTQQGEVDYGGLLRKEMDSAIEDIRGYERELWETAERSVYAKTRTGRTKIQEGLAQPLQVEPSATLRAYYDMQIADPDIRLPGSFKRDVVNKLELTADDFDRYRMGKRSREALTNNGEVPDEYLRRYNEETLELEPLKPVNANDLLNMRSQILRDLRTAQAQGDPARAHFLDRMQAAILDDLSGLNMPEFDVARKFSKELNDRFTRTFADDVLATDRSGASKIAPELLSARVFGAGRGTATNLRMKELEEAMRFVEDTAQSRYAQFATSLGENPSQAQLTELKRLNDAVITSQQRVASVTQGNARLLQMMANEAIDDATGELNPAKLNRFIANYQVALDRYGLTEDLQDARSAQQVFNAIRDPNSYINRAARSQTALANILRYESPILAVEEAMAKSNKHPVRDLTNIAKLAKKGGPEAIDGLKTVLFDIAVERAGGVKALDIDAYKSFFFGPVGRGAPSLAAVMTQQGIISPQDLKNIRRMIEPIERVRGVMTDERTVEDLLMTGGLINDFVVKVGGARVGSFLSNILPGAGNIQTPGFGAQLAQSLLLKEPNIMIRGLIEEAMLDPKLQAQLLATPRSQREKYEMKRRLHAYLGASGLNYAQFDEPEPPEEPMPAPRPPRSTMFRPAPSTRGVPGQEQPPQGGPPQGGPGPQGAAPQGNARAMLAQLFPFDTIAGMAGAQQPPAMPASPPMQ